MECIIREAVPGDAEKIADIEKECFSAPWSRKSVEEEIEKNTSSFFVAESGGAVCGYISGDNICGEMYMGNLAVSSSYRGQHIGEKLLRSLIDRGQSMDCELLTLEVRASNLPAIGLYEKCGFIKIGERKNYYSSPNENACIYTIYFNGKGV